MTFSLGFLNLSRADFDDATPRIIIAMIEEYYDIRRGFEVLRINLERGKKPAESWPLMKTQRDKVIKKKQIENKHSSLWFF